MCSISLLSTRDRGYAGEAEVEVLMKNILVQVGLNWLQSHASLSLALMAWRGLGRAFAVT